MSAAMLSFDVLKQAVAGSAAAFRLTLRLEAASPKVFPPTYEGGKYATEQRIIGGEKLDCVLLDSVPSQANRMELALQDAVEFTPDLRGDEALDYLQELARTNG